MASRDYNRQSNGRFGSGNDGGPGRPRREIEEMYLAAATEEVSVEDWRIIVGKARDQAKQGDPNARKWLSENITIGKPTERIAIDYDSSGEDVVNWGVSLPDKDSGTQPPALPEPPDPLLGEQGDQ